MTKVRLGAVLAAAFVAVWIPLSILVPAVALAAPPGLVRECSDPEFRQKNLERCNLQHDPFLIGGGGGGGQCGGLCGVLKRIPVVGSLF